jgi:hypothetical protein
MPNASDAPLCPSGCAEQPGAQVFAIVGAGADGQAGYLDRPVPADEGVLALAAPLPPASVYRVAVPCAADGCSHFEGGACQIAVRLTRRLDPAVASLPRCAIRPACRWWRQEGAAACLRCPEVATTPLAPRPIDLILAGEAGGGVKG